MPTSHNIPAHVEHHCEPCEFHKVIGCVRTRLPNCGAYTEYSCSHPKAYEEPQMKMNPGWEKFLARVGRDGRYIGKTEKQPDWCPLRREQPELPQQS